MPMYAAKVTLRKFELRRELEEMRRTRPERVKIYEAALRADDVRSVVIGAVIAGAAVAVLMFLAAIPVIVRFAKIALYG